MNRLLRSLFFLAAVVGTLAGCGPRREQTDRAFYEWRSRPFYSPADLAALDSLKITRLYVRFFDVQWSEGRNMAVPESVTEFPSPFPSHIAVVPTVYITNDVMRKLNRDETIRDLAEKIAGNIRRMVKNASIAGFNEVQIDCDWTATSRLSYFELLRQLRDRFPGVTVSATIRLHQIKYRAETGIPPVERGMLMAYNVGDVVSPDEMNSIFTADEVDKYLGRLDEYPLPLDAALPVFSWGVRFHFGRFASLIDNLTAGEMKGRNEFGMIGRNRWQARRATTLRGEQIYPGDVIRIEEPDRREVLETARTISDRIDKPRIAVALYRFDPEIIARSTPEDFRAIFRVFERE